MKRSIATDAKEVAYFASFTATPRIAKVSRHTPTQVLLENGERFQRDGGRPRAVAAHRTYIGGVSGRHIENVTPAIRERIAAAELHGDAKAVFERVWKLQEAKRNRERDALRELAKGRNGTTVEEVKTAIFKLTEFAFHNFGVVIETDVLVEKKA